MTPILITIPLSHYCEKARWALDRMDFPYEEEPHAPLLHRLAMKRGERGTVPVLVTGNSRFSDSTDILEHADLVCGGDVLYPRNAAQRGEVIALEKKFDTDLGPHARRWVYAHMLPDAKLLRTLWKRGLPPVEARWVTALAPLARYVVRAGYKITPEGVQRSLMRVRAAFQYVDDLLSDGRQFLVAERFTAADLTFAALAAPMLLPAECRAVQPSLSVIPDAMREEILRLRDTDAGRFGLRMFSQERSRRTARAHYPFA